MHVAEKATHDGVQSSITWQAMGSPCEVILWTRHDGNPAERENLLTLMTERAALLESAWTRFSDDSEISRLNRAAGSGHAVRVSDDTWTLITRMMDASVLTGGLYDPTVGNAMTAHGYDRTYTQLHDRGPTDLSTVTVPGTSRITVDDRTQSVTLPAGVSLDAGGIGKGLAADILVTELIAAQPAITGMLVNMGGDIVLTGTPGHDDHWVIAVRDEAQTTRDIGHITITPTDLDQHVGIATSTTLTKRWTAGGQPRHHVIDPNTSHPALTGLVQATAVAPAGWLAEAAATAALLLNASADEWLREHHMTGITGTPTQFTAHNNNAYATARVTA